MTRRKTGRDRLTVALLMDVVAVLEKHGYRLPADKDAALTAMGKTVANVIRLATTFEGAPFAELPDAKELEAMGCRAARLVDRRTR